MLPFVTFPMCNVYLPRRLNPLAPNEPNHPATGIQLKYVTSAVADDTLPTVPHTQLIPKKTFATGFGEQYTF